MCATQGTCGSKGDDAIPHPTSSDLVCYQRAMMACNARCLPTMCVFPKGDDVMSCPTSYDRVYFSWVIMLCHTRRHPIVCAAQGPYGHTTRNIVRLCVLSKGDNNIPRRTSSDRLCSPRVIMACHARRRPTVCAIQGRRCHATPDVL